MIPQQASAQTTQVLGDFFCWDIRTIPATSLGTTPVLLRDQFQQFDNIDMFNTFQFCDAADKDLPNAAGEFGSKDFLTPFTNPGQHFTTYTFPSTFDPPNQVDLSIVQFNQFYNNLDVGQVSEVWVPDTKKRVGQVSEDSQNPNLHYVCYDIEEDPINVDLQMDTQFGILELTVLDPILLCNPALKIHDGKSFNLDWFDQQEHLTCFNVLVKTDPVPPIPDLEWISDQLILNQQPNVPIDNEPRQHKACFESFKTDEGVAGTLVPIDSAMLLLAGAQMIGAWIIPAIVASVGIAVVIARKY